MKAVTASGDAKKDILAVPHDEIDREALEAKEARAREGALKPAENYFNKHPWSAGETLSPATGEDLEKEDKGKEEKKEDTPKRVMMHEVFPIQ